MRETRYQPVLVFAIVLLLSGCGLLGPKRMVPDRFNYSEAIGQSVRDQMLLNIVRTRYMETPVFLAVSSVVNQYGLTGGISGTLIRERPDSPGVDIDTNIGELNLQYSERPTVTYVPIGGQEFSSHLLSRVPPEVFFAAAQSGLPVDVLMRLGVRRLGKVENASFGKLSLGRAGDDFDKLENFTKVVDLFIRLVDAKVIEVQKGDVDPETDEGEEDFERFLVIADKVPRDMRPLLAEFRRLVGLSTDHNRYRITSRVANIGDDEMTVQTRSVMAIIEFVSRGVEVPVEHLEQGRVDRFGIQSAPTGAAQQLFPFRMYASPNRPRNAYAAVRFKRYWYSIERNDTISKRALNVLIILYQLRAPATEGAGPILTIPTS